MEKRQWSKYIWIGMLFVICTGTVTGSFRKNNAWKYRVQRMVSASAQEMYFPGMTYVNQGQAQTVGQWLVDKTMSWIPIVGYMESKRQYEPEMEDHETIAKILEMQANDENVVDENGKLVSGNGNSIPAQSAPVMDLSIERLRDFNYLMENFYIVDSSTMIGPEQLNADDLLGRNMKITKEGAEPKILIFHTHSQETFADSVPNDPNTSIVGVGEYLTQLLNAKGIVTIHDTGVYDIIDGKLDRGNAYENAESSVRSILAAHPSIEVAIDLHRDGVAEDTRLVTDIGGKQTAKIMYFNGLSRTRINGDIDYLYNPYIQDNLAFSMQMKVKSEQLYPGFTRPVYLRGYRYNLHLLPKSLLIEAGAQTNTVEEMRNAMEVLAEVLYQVIDGG